MFFASKCNDDENSIRDLFFRVKQEKREFQRQKVAREAQETCESGFSLLHLRPFCISLVFCCACVPQRLFIYFWIRWKPFFVAPSIVVLCLFCPTRRLKILKDEKKLIMWSGISSIIECYFWKNDDNSTVILYFRWLTVTNWEMICLLLNVHKENFSSFLPSSFKFPRNPSVIHSDLLDCVC